MTKQKLEVALVIRRRPEEEKKMVEYVEREVVVGAVVCAVDAGLAINSSDLEDIIRDLHVAEVAPVAGIDRRTGRIRHRRRRQIWGMVGMRWND